MTDFIEYEGSTHSTYNPETTTTVQVSDPDSMSDMIGIGPAGIWGICFAFLLFLICIALMMRSARAQLKD